MAEVRPPDLLRLLSAPDPPTRDAAWAAFVTTHSRLLLHTARSLNHDHDAAMDGYSYVLEALRSDDGAHVGPEDTALAVARTGPGRHDTGRQEENSRRVGVVF